MPNPSLCSGPPGAAYFVGMTAMADKPDDLIAVINMIENRLLPNVLYVTLSSATECKSSLSWNALRRRHHFAALTTAQKPGQLQGGAEIHSGAVLAGNREQGLVGARFSALCEEAAAAAVRTKTVHQSCLRLKRTVWESGSLTGLATTSSLLRPRSAPRQSLRPMPAPTLSVFAILS